MDQKYDETDLKFEETDQPNENFKFFEKSWNGSIKWGNRPKNIKKIKKKRKPFNNKYWETDTKYSEIPQQLWTFEGFPRISKKSGSSSKIIFDPFLCWGVSLLRHFHVTNFWSSKVAHLNESNNYNLQCTGCWIHSTAGKQWLMLYHLFHSDEPHLSNQQIKSVFNILL